MTALGLVSSPLCAAPTSRIKERGQINVTATLAPPATAPAGPAGSAEIEVVKEKYKSAATSTLSISVTGLGTGSYSVDATLMDASIVHLGDLDVDASVPPGPTPEPPVEIALPATLDISTVSKLTVSDTAATVVLEGAVVPTNVTWKYIANVQVSGPEVLVTSGPKPKKVRGHAVVHSFITDNVETKRGFLWVAFGAPGDTELTINVDGIAVGTVLSTKQGKVELHEIAETVVFRDVKSITLTDSQGAIVMQAAF